MISRRRDTRRPAAITQLQTLGKQLDIPVFAEGDKLPPPDICAHAVQAAKDKAYSVVILDTSGRLHIDDQLMDEMQLLKKQLNPSEILFVADAMTGQDAVKSADEFHKKLALTGVILTKMDGDARGGAALSIRNVTGQPIKFIGVGERTSRFAAGLGRVRARRAHGRPPGRPRSFRAASPRAPPANAPSGRATVIPRSA